MLKVFRSMINEPLHLYPGHEVAGLTRLPALSTNDIERRSSQYQLQYFESLLQRVGNLLLVSSGPLSPGL